MHATNSDLSVNKTEQMRKYGDERERKSGVNCKYKSYRTMFAIISWSEEDEER